MSQLEINQNLSIPYTKFRIVIDRNTTIKISDIFNEPVKIKPIAMGNLIIPDIYKLEERESLMNIIDEGYTHNLNLIKSDKAKRVFDYNYVYANYITVGFLLSTRVKKFNTKLLIFNEFTIGEYLKSNTLETIIDRLKYQNKQKLNKYFRYKKIKRILLSQGIIKRVPVNEISIDIDFKPVKGIFKSTKYYYAKILLAIIYRTLHDKLIKYGDVKYYITPSDNIRVMIQFDKFSTEISLFNHAYYKLARENLYEYRKIINEPYLVGNNIETLEINTKSVLSNDRLWKQKALIRKEINKLFFELFKLLQNLSSSLKAFTNSIEDNSSFVIYDFVNTNEGQFITDCVTLLKHQRVKHSDNKINKCNCMNNELAGVTYHMTRIKEDTLKSMQLKTYNINELIENVNFNNLYYTVSSIARVNNRNALYTARVKVNHLNKQTQIDLHNIHRHTIRLLDNRDYPDFYSIINVEDIITI